MANKTDFKVDPRIVMFLRSLSFHEERSKSLFLSDPQLRAKLLDCARDKDSLILTHCCLDEEGQLKRIHDIWSKIEQSLPAPKVENNLSMFSRKPQKTRLVSISDKPVEYRDLNPHSLPPIFSGENFPKLRGILRRSAKLKSEEKKNFAKIEGIPQKSSFMGNFSANSILSLPEKKPVTFKTVNYSLRARFGLPNDIVYSIINATIKQDNAAAAELCRKVATVSGLSENELEAYIQSECMVQDNIMTKILQIYSKELHTQ